MAKIKKVNESNEIGLREIDPSALYALIYGMEDSYKEQDYIDEFGEHESANWKIVHSTLTSSDNEDGGGHYDIVLEHLPTGRLYETSYNDWDMENTEFEEETGKVITDDEGGRCDLGCGLQEVRAQQQMITVYVPV